MALERFIRRRTLLSSVIGSCVRNDPNNRRHFKDIPDVESYVGNYLNIRWRCDEVSDLGFYCFSTLDSTLETVSILENTGKVYPPPNPIRFQHRILHQKIVLIIGGLAELLPTSKPAFSIPLRRFICRRILLGRKRRKRSQ